MIVQIKKLFEEAELPTKGSSEAAGWDIRAFLNTAYTLIYPGETQKIPTGIAIKVPKEYECQVRSRSGMAYNGIQVANSPGTIDSDYRGEVGVLLYNSTDDVVKIEHNDRVAQLVFKKVPTVILDVVEELDETERGKGGFGSTGVN